MVAKVQHLRCSCTGPYHLPHTNPESLVPLWHADEISAEWKVDVRTSTDRNWRALEAPRASGERGAGGLDDVELAAIQFS